MSMDYKIVVDSSCEIPEELLNRANMENVPFEIQVGEERILDDETLKQDHLLQVIAETEECAKTSCPSPDRFLSSYEEPEAKRVYVVTISSELSGSYNSACLAKNLFEEEYEDKKIHIFDSKAASVGETQIMWKIIELEEAGLPFEEIVKKVEKFRDNLKLFFILDNLETLRKNGRLTALKARVASTLNIKPVLASDREGKIVQVAQAIGMRKGLNKLVESVMSVERETKKRIVISHCNCVERAEKLEKMLRAKMKEAEIYILDMSGLSSTYANDGGIIVTV